MPTKKFDAKEFQRLIKIRPLRTTDYDAITRLQLECFPGMKPWARDQYESLLRIFPEGQLCVVYRGKIVGSSSSLVIDFDLYGENHTWNEITSGGTIRNHTPHGDTLYGIEIMVDPKYRGMRLARRLYEARKQLCRERNLQRIVIGGRLPGYHQHQAKLTVREYVQKVVDKKLFDPVLTTQLSNGFVLKRLLHGYFGADEASAGNATLLEWTNIDHQPDTHRRYVPARNVRICAVQYQMRKIQSFDDFATQCGYFMDVAAGYRCDFVLFPELLTTQLLSIIREARPGVAARKVAEYTPEYLDLFSRLAVKYNVNTIGGTHLTLENDDLYNVAYLFTRDGQIYAQPKLHVTPNERRWWGVKPGDRLDVFKTDKANITIQVCYDVEFPELSRIAVEKGAELLFVPFCTDERKGYLRVRYCAQARCVENHLYTAMAGTVGNLPDVENMDVQYAQSAILTPSDFLFARDGVAAECTPNVETVVIHDVDLEQLRRHRRAGTTLNWEDRRVDLYEVRMKGEPTTARPLSWPPPPKA